MFSVTFLFCSSFIFIFVVVFCCRCYAIPLLLPRIIIIIINEATNHLLSSLKTKKKPEFNPTKLVPICLFFSLSLRRTDQTGNEKTFERQKRTRRRRKRRRARVVVAGLLFFSFLVPFWSSYVTCVCCCRCLVGCAHIAAVRAAVVLVLWLVKQ